ncbi:VPS35 endosomal protein-sorting factor-like isoform X2 [Galleria mellonella]|uniref:VPS35 endosomal protein-sorting factor-like isoform X2 n=1 Tax=Galleria mellonella TaxID=7137 RepID=A0ABM3N1Z0_GALME|nr:VPS35 endosomal protein-sorting factor-like isoform X2 [Galleria mellonella]
MMPVYYQWSSLKKQNCNKQDYPRFEVSSHPLKSNVAIVNDNATARKSLMDSLSKWSSAFEEVDPLLRFEQMNMEDDLSHIEVIDKVSNYSKTWNLKRSAILSKYTTGEKLTIISSFLPGGEKTLIRQVSNLNEKVKHRLEQLDDFDEGSVRKTMGLSQQEFVVKINMLNDEIKKAWDSEQRVKAFKIGIQCSKLLSDVTVMQFYPSKFVLITDILDTFGNLVFDRLKLKSYGTAGVNNIQDIDPAQVPESAKETCQNWLFKMASIRELLPRLYMEMSLLKCYLFISKEEIKPAVARLTKMIRGIGNPLVAAYLRVYLCNVASKILGQDSEDIYYNNLKEFLDDYQQIFHQMMRKKYEAQLLTMDKYLNLYVPAVDWLMYCTLNDSSKCKQTLLEELLAQCEQIENNELLLCCVVSAFDSSNIIKKSSCILEMVENDVDRMVLINEVLSSLGEHLCTADNYRHQSAETLIQTFWKIASSMQSALHFLQVLEPWLQFACTHLSTQHVNIILRGTIRYMVKCGRPADDFSGNFQFVLKRMLKSIPDVEELFLMDAFMPLVELVQTSNARTMMAKTVLSMFFSRYDSNCIEDHIIISSLMRLCTILHDSINAVTVEDESKLYADLINKFIQAVSYQDDFEQQLNFYVESRSAFIKLDAVLVTLVHAVNALSLRGAGGAGGAGAASGGWLQRACAAYCFVTVPSLHCAITKLHLYLLSGQVALLNNCIGQAEANFKALIGLIPDIPDYILEDGQKKPTHTKVAGILSDFLSTMLILPDNLDSNCKAYILSGLIKTIERIHWKKTEPLYYSTLLRILDLLCEMTQEKYAYHLDSVLSNDVLYGSETEFVEIIENYATNICQELLVVLKMLGDVKETKKQYNLALELFWRVIRRGDLLQGPMLSLAANLWMLSQKLQDSNNKLAKTMLLALQNDSKPASRRLLQKLEESSKAS